MPIPTKDVTFFRTDKASGFLPLEELARVERTGGDYGAGIIRNAAILTRGEAKGHGAWIDSTMLRSVAERINEASSGLKSRFTHPGMSSDGLGKLTARVKGPAELRGDTVYADLHIVESSRDTPDGDLGGYVMDLAEKDGDLFGVSIVFEHDLEAEESFANEYRIDGEFISPDAENLEDFYHVRLGDLMAADVVDEPAANPNGLFSRSDLPREYFALLNYCCGLTDEKPTNYEADPDRVKQFFNRFLLDNQLEIRQMATKTAPKATEKETPKVEPEKVEFDALAARKAEAEKYTAEFGEELGAKYFMEGVPFHEAKDCWAKDTIFARDQEITSLRDALSAQAEKIESLGAELKSKDQIITALQGDQNEPLDTSIKKDGGKKKTPWN